MVHVRFGPFHIYLLNSPDAIRQALVSQARKLEKGLNFGRAKRLIGNGLVMSEGESHRRQRRLMQPAFHRAEIARYVDTMRDVAVPRIQAVDEIERLLRVLLSELMAQGITANVPGLAWVPTRSNRRFSAASRRLRTMLTGIIDEYRATGTDRDDLISILMRASDDETGTGMTSRQLRDEALKRSQTPYGPCCRCSGPGRTGPGQRRQSRSGTLIVRSHDSKLSQSGKRASRA